MQLVRPTLEHLPRYVAALQRGWSPDNVRGAAAAEEELQRIAADPQAFVASLDDPQAKGGPVLLPDGSQVARLPSLRRWMWLDGDVVGSIGLRWTADGSPLPPHVLGHIGYAVVPWARGHGHASQALRLMLAVARERGLARVEVTTDGDNLASQRVVANAGGRWLEDFDKPAAYGGKASKRFALDTAPLAPAQVLPVALEHAEGFHACLDAVAREKRFLAQTEALPLERIRGFVQQSVADDAVQFMAVAGGRVVGWADIFGAWPAATQHCGSLGMGLLPPWRGSGVGRQLLQACLDKALTKGLTRITLEVRADNGRAIALYERLGFEREALKQRALRYDGAYFDAWQMVRLQGDAR